MPRRLSPAFSDRMVQGATRARHDARHAVTGAAGDAMDARGVDGFWEGHLRQDGGEPARQHGCACFGRTQQQMVADQNSAA